MPPKKSPDLKGEKAECILQYGKNNNVIQWSTEMQTSVAALYGLTGTFFSTNVRYIPPIPIEEDYTPQLPADAEGNIPPHGLPAALIAKLREGAYEGRRRDMEKQKGNERTIWPLMWTRMSPASQSKVREEEGFEAAHTNLDCVQLWQFIRRSHLTHIFGNDDPMAEINRHEQEARYSALRQGDREYVSTFKGRYDNQLKACVGAGVAAIPAPRQALDFIMKLDAKRYKTMLASMRNDAVRNVPNAYPDTLASAFRIASGWTNEGPSSAYAGESDGNMTAAYLADSCFITRTDQTKKAGRKQAIRGKKTNTVCFVCGDPNHIASECALRKLPPDDMALVTTNSDEAEEEEVFDAAFITNSFGEDRSFFTDFEVLLDNEASLNIFRSDGLVSNIRKSTSPVTLGGVQRGAKGVKISLEGDFEDIGTVYVSKDSAANIISFACMIDKGAVINYEKNSDIFTLQPKGSLKTYVFSRKAVNGSENKFYICDVRHGVKDATEDTAMIATVRGNMTSLTKRELEGAHKARTALARMGFPSVTRAIEIVNTGRNFDITGHDFKVAEQIWGPNLASIKGKTKLKVVRAADQTISGLVAQVDQILSIDIMFVEKVPLLIGVAHPLDLTLVTHMRSFDQTKISRGVEVVERGIREFISILKSRNFSVPLLMCDGEGAVSALKDELGRLGVELDISGAGGHVQRVERKIQTVKERVRSYVSYHLPFTLSTLGIIFLVMYCVSRLNYQISGTRPQGPSPREMFVGRPTDAMRDFRCCFGEYVQATMPTTDNSMRARTEGCIVLLPTGNRTGSVKMLCLRSGKVVTRDNFTILPMPEEAIQRMNELAMLDGRVKPRTGESHREEEPIHTEDTVEAAVHGDVQTQVMLDDGGGDPIVGVETHDEHPHLVLADESGHIAEGEDRAEEDSELGDQQPIPVDDCTETQVTGGKSTPVKRDVMEFFRRGVESQLALTTSATASVERKILGGDTKAEDRTRKVTVRAALRTHGETARSVIEAELKQMLDKKVWSPICLRSLSIRERGAIIRSSMFLKEKFLASGSFEKLKARLVAGGDQQDRDLYEDLSAPTVATSSLYTIAAVAGHENRYISVIDISGAYLNANMSTGVKVHMRLDRTISSLLIGISPSYGRYIDNQGCIVVILNKALYGCVESAALWYEHLKGTLERYGFRQNRYDQCIYNRTEPCGHQCTLAVHVDDILVTCASQEAVNLVGTQLRSAYGKINEVKGPVVGYLGMEFDVTVPGETRITMKGFIENLIDGSQVTGEAATPAGESLFDVREDSEKLNDNERKRFHTYVAKIRYAANRARPDCLVAAAFLATRVTKSDKDDLGKLSRLLKYINGTRERGIVLRAGTAGIQVSAYIDAAYGVHTDGKSHTGSVIVIGDSGAVHCKSTKQSIVTKSSTEAELVALSDSANQAFHIRNFLCAQGHDLMPVTIYQDNLSCIAMAERGRSTSERTRHISIRYYWLKERVDKGEARITHLRTEGMYANVLTKPLQGSQFRRERLGVTGWA